MRGCLFVLLFTLMASVAETQPTLSGVVVDSAGLPIAGAELRLFTRATTLRSRADGTFRFDSVAAGRHSLLARAIGYEAQVVTLDVRGAGFVSITMKRVATSLPAVVTRARPGGLSGVIADTAFRAMDGVSVKALGSGSAALTASGGRFFLPLKPGSYLIRLERDGFARQTISVTVPRDSGSQIAAWMVPQVGKPNPVEGANLFDLEQRLMRRSPVTSRLYTREDFKRIGYRDARSAAQAFAVGPIGDDECALLNGGPSWVPLWSIMADEIEFMETYARSGNTRRARSIRGRVDARPPGGCNHVVWLRK